LICLQILLVSIDNIARRAIDKFLDAIPAIGADPDRCQGSDCLAQPVGFYHGSLPWLGQPLKINVDQQVISVKIQCFVTNPTVDLTLMKNGRKIILQDHEFKVSVEVVNDIKKAEFEIFQPFSDKIGKFYCVNSQDGIESVNFVEINQNQQNHPVWSDWSAWSKCDNVGVDQVIRSRNSSIRQNDTQTKFCQCSDLKELPRPRY
jgi:hypothetical protein